MCLFLISISNTSVTAVNTHFCTRHQTCIVLSVLVCTDHSPFHVLTVHPPCVPARGTSSTSDCFFQLHHSTGCFLFLSHRAGEDLSLVEYCSPFSSSDRWERKKINIYIYKKAALSYKKGGGEAAQALNMYTIKFWHSFQI